jgi:hypothetical protein
MSSEYFLVCKEKEDYVNIGKLKDDIDSHKIINFFNRNNGMNIFLFNDNQFLDFCNEELKKDVLQEPILKKIFIGD